MCVSQNNRIVYEYDSDTYLLWNYYNIYGELLVYGTIVAI